MAAEPPLGVERRELVWLLVQAAELEHGLMCEYLFAQFTLKRSRDEGLSGEQLATVAAWEQVLIDVIKQEMLHLALTTNLLTAIGAAPPAPAELPHPVALVSAWGADRPGPVRGTSPAALHLPGTPRRDGPSRRRGLRRRRPGQPLTNGDELMAVPEDYQTVGHLYRGIEHGLERLVQRHGEDGVFIGPPNAQATTEVFEWPELTAVTDLASAKAAIELIVEQGEGARGGWRSAHFGKFVALLQAYRAARAVDPAFEPARPVEPAYVRRPPDVEAEVATVGDPSRPRSPTCSTRSMRPRCRRSAATSSTAARPMTRSKCWPGRPST